MKKLYMASGVDSILRPWKQKDDKVTQLGRPIPQDIKQQAQR